MIQIKALIEGYSGNWSEVKKYKKVVIFGNNPNNIFGRGLFG